MLMFISLRIIINLTKNNYKEKPNLISISFKELFFDGLLVNAGLVSRLLVENSPIFFLKNYANSGEELGRFALVNLWMFAIYFLISLKVQFLTPRLILLHANGLLKKEVVKNLLCDLFRIALICIFFIGILFYFIYKYLINSYHDVFEIYLILSLCVLVKVVTLACGTLFIAAGQFVISIIVNIVEIILFGCAFLLLFSDYTAFSVASSILISSVSGGLLSLFCVKKLILC